MTTQSLDDYIGHDHGFVVAPLQPILSNRRELYHLAIKVSVPAVLGWSPDQSHSLEHRFRQALEDIVGLEIRTMYVSRLPWPDEQP
jgi:hypothetical protein